MEDEGKPHKELLVFTPGGYALKNPEMHAMLPGQVPSSRTVTDPDANSASKAWSRASNTEVPLPTERVLSASRSKT